MLAEISLNINKTDPEAVGVEDTMSAVGCLLAGLKSPLPVLLIIVASGWLVRAGNAVCV